MKVRSVANDGLLVYVDLYAEEPYDKVIELRFEHETNEHYIAWLWGNMLPLYFMYDEVRNVDRVFIRLPYLEDRMVLPIYVERILINRMVFDDPLFLLYDRGRMPYYITGISGDYFINQTGFHLNGATVALDYVGELPLKVKFIITEDTYNATFELIDPVNQLRKWIVDINNGILSINGNTVTTLANGMREIDFGFSTSKLVLTFYEESEQVYSVSDTSPLDEATSIDDTIMRISGTGITIEDFIVLRSAPEPAVIVGYVEYTDILELITSGFPKLNYPQRNGIVITEGGKLLEKYVSLREVGEAQSFDSQGIKVVLGEYHVSDSPVELKIVENVDDKFACELIITQDNTHDFGTELKVVTVEQVSNNEIKISVPDSDIWFYGILSDLREWIEEKFVTLRSVHGADEATYGVKVTVTSGGVINDVANYGAFLNIDKVKESIVDYLVIAMKKYYGYAHIYSKIEDEVLVLADYDDRVEVTVNEE